MEPESRSGWGLNAQLNALMIVAVLVPVVAVAGLGAWIITSFGQGQPLAGLPSAAGMDPTLLEVVTIAVTMLVLVAVALPVLRMRAAVRNRLMDLAEVCRQASMGQRGARALVTGDDDFARLAVAVNAVIAGRPPVGRMPVGDAATLQGQIEKLLQEVSSVGEGDLRVQAEVTPDTLGVLADSFNYMIEELAKVVSRVQATALQVTNGTRRLLDRSAEIAQASDMQAQQINATSDAVARLADFVQLSANNALAAARAADETLRNAQVGRQAVVQTIGGMDHIRENVQDTAKKVKRLGERAQEVGEIVRLIEDIADQTNLLALNAAIQSAMAGEHGRGFAVVADEIRALAERVSEATKRVSTLVKSIQGDTYEAVVAMEESTSEVVSGSKIADEAGRALQSIYGAVERQAQMVESIAAAAGERQQTAEAVARAVAQIAEIARQTNAATQDATYSVRYLAEVAEQLRASVATFRLPEQLAESVDASPGAEPSYMPPMAAQGALPPGGWSSGMGSVPSQGFSGMPSEAPVGANWSGDLGNLGSFGADFGGLGGLGVPGGFDAPDGGMGRGSIDPRGFTGSGVVPAFDASQFPPYVDEHAPSGLPRGGPFSDADSHGR